MTLSATDFGQRLDHAERMRQREIRPDQARKRVRVTFRQAPDPLDCHRTRARAHFAEAAAGQTVVAGKRLVPDAEGVAEAVIYADQLPQLEANVETELELLATARRVHGRELRKHLLGAYEAGDQPETLPEDPNQWPDHVQRAAATYGGSVEQQFFKLTERGIKPFVKVEVLEELDPPDQPEHAFARTLARAQSAGGAGGMSQADLMALGKAIGEAVAANIGTEKPSGKGKGK